MEWTGIAPQTLGIAALIGAAILLLLFFLRPRPQVLAVASHVLWKQVVPKRMNPLLKEIIALLLQLLILAAVVCALGMPQRMDEEIPVVDEAGVVRPRDRVMVVDLSASMGAVEGDGTRLDGVRTRLQRMMDDLAEGERMAIVHAAQTATVAVPLTADPARLGLAIRSLRVLPGRADLDEAMAMAALLVAGADGPAEIRVFADQPVAAPALNEDTALVVEPVGTALPNVAVTAFDVRATEGLPAQMEAFVEVTNFAAFAATVTVSIETPTRILGHASYDLPPGERFERIYRFFPPDEDQVEVVLKDTAFHTDEGPVDAVDALTTDDTACAYLPGLRPARVLLVSRGNQYLEMVLKLVPDLKLEIVSPDNYKRGAVASGRYDVVFYDSFVPENPPKVNSFFINPRVAVAGFSLVRRVEAPPTTDWNLGHPLFANLVLRDLNVAVSGQFEQGPNDVRLIGTPTGPIALARESGGVKQIVFGFDFADSDLPLRVAFPQLIFNTVLWAREGRAVSPPAGPQLLARDAVWLEPSPGVEGLALAVPQDEESTEPARRVKTVPGGDGPVRIYPSRTGFLEILGTDSDGPVAVSMLDPIESDLRMTPAPDKPAALPTMPPVDEGEQQAWWPPWVWLGLAALLLMLGEFALVNR